MKLLESSLVLLSVFFLLHQILAASFTNLADCIDQAENGKVINLSIRSKRNGSGNWVTSFALFGNYGNATDTINLDLKQMVAQKNREDLVLLQGTLGVVLPIVEDENTNLDLAEASREPLVFHERTGKNIRLSNNGRTAERINPNDDFKDAIVVTNRALKDNELFEVRLDEVVREWSGSLDFGVTFNQPKELPISSFHGDFSTEYAWFYGTEVTVDDKYKVGDRFGLMRTPSGEVQYYLNGTFVGTASSMAPEKVYGIVDVYGNAVKVTIINPPLK